MAENRSDIIIGTKSGDTEQKLKNIAKQLKNVGTTVTDTGKKAKAAGADMEKSFKRVGDAIQAVAMGATAKMAYSLAQEAASFQEVSQYAELMANRAGMSFDRLVSASQRGANGMASSAEIMKTNLKAMRAGLKASEDDFGKLWQIADAMSDQMGVSITQAFEQITTAITTGNQKSLVSMGLLPEAFGKVSSATDLLTRRSETLKLVLEKLGPQAEEVSRQGDTAADKFTQLDNKVKDLKLHIGEQLLPVTTTLVEGLKDIAEYGIEAAKAIGWLTGGDTGVKNDVSKLGAVGVAEIKQQLINSKKAQRDDVLKLYNQATSGGLSSYDIQRVARNYGGGAGVKTNEDAITVLFSNLRALNKEIKNAETELDNFKQKARVDVWVAQGKEFCDGVMTKAWNIAERLTTKTGETKNNVGKISGHTKDAAAEADKLLAKYGNLADSVLPKIPETEKEAYDLLVKISAAAGGIGTAFMESDKNLESLNKRLEETLSKLSGDYADSLTKNTLEAQFMNKGFGDQINGIGAGMFALAGGNIGVNPITGEIAGKKVNPDDVKTAAKSGWSAIKQDFSEGMAAAMTQGIVDSDLASALASFGKSQAANYGSQLLGGLLSSGTGGLSGAFATGGAGWGLVAGVAIDYVASNWKKWTGDKHKEETMAAVNDATVRGSNAYLNTYKSELNPYISYEDLARIYQARSDVWTKGMTVSYKWKDTDWHWLTGSSSYSNTTPQSTYDVIAALEKANELAEKSATQKERELDLLAAQGYDYQVTKEQLQSLASAVDRISLSERQFNWSNGEKFSIDLSENIQDLKKAYYEALKQYGEETASINTRNASQYLSYAPFISQLYYGTYYPNYGSSRVNMRAGSYGGVDIYDTYDMWGDYADFFKYNRFEEIASDYYEGRNANKAMFEMVKNIGENQYNLAALQINDPAAYAEEYLSFLEKQMNAAAYIMEQQEYIYADATKTYEEQSAALEMYQQAQDQYYNAKLEVLAQEQAKEEEIKKQEQQAALRSQERMEALLGFTGEMAKTGNSIYILEGADQVGALRELEQHIDDPETLAFIQRAITAAQNKNKYGKIA